jgi:hypothetical protein
MLAGACFAVSVLQLLLPDASVAALGWFVAALMAIDAG